MYSAKLLGILVVLSASAGAVVAQPVGPPIIRNPSNDTAAVRAEVREGIAAARTQEKSAALTRQQIQVMRSALRAKLTALHH